MSDFEQNDDIDLRSQILGAKDIKETEMIIEEWGNAKILVKELNGADRAEVLNQSMRKDGSPDMTRLYPLMVIKSVRYPYGHKKEGERIFQLSDKEALSQKAGSVIERISIQAMAISGMSDITAKELEKN